MMGGRKRGGHGAGSKGERERERERENTYHRKYDHEDGFLFPWRIETSDERQWDEEHEGVGGDVEAGLHDRVVLKSCALRVRWWHGPISFEWCACCEEGDFGGHPTNSDKDG